MLKRTGLLAVTATLLLTGCGGSEETAAEPATDSPTEAPASAAASEAPSASAEPSKAGGRCLAIDVANVQRLADGAEPDVGTITFTEAAAVKSEDFSEVYMVAGRFDAPGVPGEVGVWATNDIDPIGGGLLLAVDGFAKQFTVWPDADKSQAAIEQSADGVSEARDCLD